MARIYIASKTRHAGLWKALRDAGVPIISSWIDEAGKGETLDWGRMWQTCFDQAATATHLIIYVQEGEILKGAWIEVGVALANSVPVFGVGIDDYNIIKYPKIMSRPSIDVVLREITYVENPPAWDDGDIPF